MKKCSPIFQTAEAAGLQRLPPHSSTSRDSAETPGEKSCPWLSPQLAGGTRLHLSNKFRISSAATAWAIVRRLRRIAQPAQTDNQVCPSLHAGFRNGEQKISPV